MIPSLIFESLAGDPDLDEAGISEDRIIESESVDSRPFKDGYFLTVSFEEMSFSGVSALSRGPRVCTIAVHHPFDEDRDFAPLTAILNRIDAVLLPLEVATGEDGRRVTGVRRQGRSGNLVDEGWKTITRTATYGVLYDEYAA